MKRLARDFVAMAVVTALVLSPLLTAGASAKGPKAKEKVPYYQVIVTTVVTAVTVQFISAEVDRYIVKPASDAVDKYIVQPIKDAITKTPPELECHLPTLNPR